MFKRKRKSDPTILSSSKAEGTPSSDYSEEESNVLQDAESQKLPKYEEKKKKKKKSITSDMEIVTKTKKTGTSKKSGEKLLKKSKNKDHHLQSETQLVSPHQEDAGINTLAADSFLKAHYDQQLSTNDKIKDQEDRGDTRHWSQSVNQTSDNPTYDSKDDYVQVTDASGVKREIVDSGSASPDVCYGGSKTVHPKNYDSFLRDMDGATGSSLIQSEDSYEKLRYSTPWMERSKEATVSSDSGYTTGTLFHGRTEPESRSTSRDMETRNSDDIIISGSLKNRRPMQYSNSGMETKRQKGQLPLLEYREETPSEYYSDRSTMKGKKVHEFNSRENNPKIKLPNVANSTFLSDSNRVNKKKILLHHDAEAQTKTASISAMEIATCCSMEEIRSLQKSLVKFLSQSRLTMDAKNNDQTSKTERKYSKEKIVPHVLVANADSGLRNYRDFPDSCSPVNNFPKNNFRPEKCESRKSCRCGNGCGASVKSTCCCKRI